MQIKFINWQTVFLIENHRATVGRPPFGSPRNTDGFLAPSLDSAWLLPDGTFIQGQKSDEVPTEGAIWRGYYNVVMAVLTRYAQGDIGLEKLAYSINAENLFNL